MEQRRFMRATGARIIRIFVSDQQTPPLEYQEVMTLMNKYGIETSYVYRAEPDRVEDVTWVPSLHLLMEWIPRSSGYIGQINLGVDTTQNLE